MIFKKELLEALLLYFSALVHTPLTTIPAGYHSGGGKVSANNISLRISNVLVAKRKGGNDRLEVPQQTISNPRAYCIVCGKCAAYSNGARLEGYINGRWETIKTISSSNTCYDDGGNGGQALQFGYASGLITKPYTSVRLYATGTSVHPDFAVAYLFSF